MQGADVIARAQVVELDERVYRIALTIDEIKMSCTRFRRHQVRCFDGTGGGSWNVGSLHASSSKRLFG